MRGFSWAFGRTGGAHAQAIDSVSSTKAQVLAPAAALPRGRGVAGNLVPKTEISWSWSCWLLGSAGAVVATAQEIGGRLFFRICFGPDLFWAG